MAEEATRVEKANTIRANLARHAAETAVYPSWDDAFCRKQAIDLVERLRNALGRISFEGMSTAEADAIGMGRWGEETGLRLIPLYLYPFLTPGETLQSISGRSDVVGDPYDVPGEPGYIDNDHRFGCLAYGVIPAT